MNIVKQAPRSEVINYFAQVSVLFIVVIACILNLSIYPNSETRNLWVTLLTAALGFMMPNPRFKLEDTKESPIHVAVDNHGQ